MTAARQIGIAGLGLLGSALAHRLLTAGFTPKGFRHRRREDGRLREGRRGRGDAG